MLLSFCWFLVVVTHFFKKTERYFLALGWFRGLPKSTGWFSNVLLLGLTLIGIGLGRWCKIYLKGLVYVS